MGLRIISGILLLIWIVLVVRGKGGFAHLLLLSAFGIAVVEMMVVYRSRMKV
ncbi:MAG: hypothetical protein ABJB40_01810 [Acidobacteriota bacterium]